MGNAFVKAGQLPDAIKAYSDSLVENRCVNFIYKFPVQQEGLPQNDTLRRSKEVEKKLKDVEKQAKDMAAKAYINPVNMPGRIAWINAKKSVTWSGARNVGTP
jgi:hypothetical protein